MFQDMAEFTVACRKNQIWKKFCKIRWCVSEAVLIIKILLWYGWPLTEDDDPACKPYGGGCEAPATGRSMRIIPSPPCPLWLWRGLFIVFSADGGCDLNLQHRETLGLTTDECWCWDTTHKRQAVQQNWQVINQHYSLQIWDKWHTCNSYNYARISFTWNHTLK